MQLMRVLPLILAFLPATSLNATTPSPSETTRNDYNQETPIIWLDKSELPVSVECLIAFAWICMVASMPLVVIYMDGKNITRSQIINFAVMWVILGIGVYLFNQILLFNSVHFQTERSLTLVECVYLMSQIITTVGYGDITPAHAAGQIFVAIYVIFALLIIANVVSEVVDQVSGHAAEYAKDLDKVTTIKSFTPRPEEPPPEQKQETAKKWISKDPPPLPWNSFLSSLAVYGFFCVIGTLFFVNYPGENKTVLQGLYMSVITLSTVGFGAVTPVTEGGKVFGAFWMLFGSAALVGVVGSFSSLCVMSKQREEWDPVAKAEEHREALMRFPEELDGYNFMKFGLSVQHKVLSNTEFRTLEKAFRHLGPAADGTISKEDARRFLDLAEGD
eukprot:CAMPEP_0172783000 /NCGR_PEP_ID=MMETSP1074-20121228/204216_1 /TAXON_ID=2916 /ORGANISM="Ceratium fusus, Strain PA161109" /LENGTH=388 /DNA_ID=CAMNT_0013619987 /DNA_START=76 /DNA_END=1242 /DNA_ORIENTATION=+